MLHPTNLCVFAWHHRDDERLIDHGHFRRPNRPRRLPPAARRRPCMPTAPPDHRRAAAGTTGGRLGRPFDKSIMTTVPNMAISAAPSGRGVFCPAADDPVHAYGIDGPPDASGRDGPGRGGRRNGRRSTTNENHARSAYCVCSNRRR